MIYIHYMDMARCLAGDGDAARQGKGNRMG